MTDVHAQYDALVQPSDVLVAELAGVDGDILILGVGGKMGPSLAKLAAQAVDRAGAKKRIIGVARFSEPGLQEQLRQSGVETHAADLLDDDQLEHLPDASNVLYLAGTKFGTTGNESLTWAMNVYVPGRVAQKYRHSRIVVFSTGNVYPLTTVTSGGATEETPPDPIGEYAQSCLGRERLFRYFSSRYKTPVLMYRLNYANDVTYGVLLEIAMAVNEERPIDVSMGHVNVIWQGDANEMALRALRYCETPAKLLNVAGPETVSVRWLAEQFGMLFDKTPAFVHEEHATALLSNAAEACRLFGAPRVSL